MDKRFLMLLLGLGVLANGCKPSTPLEGPEAIQRGMVKVAILYPNGEGKTFDMAYYADHHMPMLARLFGDALKKVAIDQGLSGRTPDEPAPYLAIGYLYFDDLEAYQQAFAPHSEKIRGDVPNYTNTRPIVQISTVRQ